MQTSAYIIAPPPDEAAGSTIDEMDFLRSSTEETLRQVVAKCGGAFLSSEGSPRRR